MNFWTKVLMWLLWVALIVWWLTPEIDLVKERIVEHNKQIEKAFSE